MFSSYRTHVGRFLGAFRTKIALVTRRRVPLSHEATRKPRVTRPDNLAMNGFDDHFTSVLRRQRLNEDEVEMRRSNYTIHELSSQTKPLLARRMIRSSNIALMHDARSIGLWELSLLQD
jgi:hypothetical protein